MPDATEDATEDTSEDATEDTSEDATEDATEDTSEDATEDTSEDTSEDATSSANDEESVNSSRPGLVIIIRPPSTATGVGGRTRTRRPRSSPCSTSPPRLRPRLAPLASNPAIRQYTLEEITFYRGLAVDVQESVILRETEVISSEDALSRRPLRFRVIMSSMTTRNKVTALRKISMLKGDTESSSHHKISEWINGLLSLPIGRYTGLPVTCTSPPEQIGVFLKAMRTQLDAAVYGHATVKDHVVRLLAQWISKPTSRGLVLGIHGPPGVGKTELCRAICRCLGLPFAFVPLGGISDGSHLDGHSYTYEGAVWGKISDVLMKCGCMNPVLFFDELDKISETRHGDEIVNLLIHMTDSTQNTQFADKYFVDIDIDLSRCLMVFSYNDESRVSPVLLDRMTRIRADGYSASEKVSIAQAHLLPSILGEFGLDPGAVRASRDIVHHILAKNNLGSEAGVRGLKRALHNVVSHLNYERLVRGVEGASRFSIELTESHVDTFVCPSSAGNTAMSASVRGMYA